MEFNKTINKRKSIRSFENKQVPKKILKQLVADAAKAPSSGNSQPWKFYVVASKNVRDKAAKILAKALDVYKADKNRLPKKLQDVLMGFYPTMGGCQNVIFIYTTKGNSRDSNLMSVSAAAENLILSAVSRGLGTCWVGSFRRFEKEISRLINAPKDEELVASILVGFPKKGYVPLKRKKKQLRQILKFV